jgi:hypothetical protein
MVGGTGEVSRCDFFLLCLICLSSVQGAEIIHRTASEKRVWQEV